MIRTLLLALAALTVRLPDPGASSEMTVEEAIASRRSVRGYTGEAITLEELSALLYSAQGITSENGLFRAAPSAGATYPLTLLVAAARVDSLEPGIYRYIPEENSLRMVASGDSLASLAAAALGQRCVGDAAAVLVLAADYSITTSVYGERGVRYVDMEAGHAAQNVYLQCTAMSLGTVGVGAFIDDNVEAVVCPAMGLTPIYLLPVGRPALR